MVKKIFLAAMVLAFSGCTDKLTLRALNGIYTGKFYYLPPNENITVSADANVSFSDNNYSSEGNTNYVPAGGSGTFEISKYNMIGFKDQNVWAANFDWGLILNGKYKYQVNGDSLILTRYNEPCPSCSLARGTYQYRLKRSN